VLLSVMCLCGLSLAATEAPTDFIRRTTESIVRMFEDPQLRDTLPRQERLQRLRDIAKTTFDWPEIAKRALATHWRERTPEERQEFTALFREFVLATYLERLEAAAPQGLQEKQAILYIGEQVSGQQAVVRTTVVTKRFREIPLDYRLRESEGQWRIYDILIMGVSLVSNYRAQFQRIIAQSSYQELVRQLRARQLREVFAEPPHGSR
jgi:phospholipid transport system substrate-binding protein